MKLFNRPPEEPTDLEELIANHITVMDGIGPETEEYTAQADNLKTLMEIRKLEDEIEKPWRPSADTVVLVAGNIIGIGAILLFEQKGVITTKSLGLLLKPRTSA